MKLYLLKETQNHETAHENSAPARGGMNMMQHSSKDDY